MDRESILCEMNDYAVNMPADDFHSLYRNNSVEIGDKKKTYPHVPEHILTFNSFPDYLGVDPTQVASSIIYIVHIEQISKYIEEHPDAVSKKVVDLPIQPIMFVERLFQIIWDKVMLDPKRLMLIGAVIAELGHTCLVRRVGEEVSRNISFSTFKNEEIKKLTIENLEGIVVRLMNGEKIAAMAVDTITGKTMEFNKEEDAQTLSQIKSLLSGITPNTDITSMLERLKKKFRDTENEIKSDDPE